MPQPLDPQHDQFLRLYAEQEQTLHGYVRSMLPDRHETSEVMQEVIVTLWQKFEGAEDFRKWAFGVARMKVLHHLQRKKRDRHVTAPSHPSRWFAWRPLTAAAAGLAIGLFGASVVFGFVSQGRERVISLFEDGFEEVKAVFGRGFPDDAGGWSGDFAAVVPAEGSVSPKEGQYMARLVPAADRKFCAAARIVDFAEFPLLSGTESRTVEITASFHGMGKEWADRNQIRLAAFAEAPHEVKAIWNADTRLEQALQHIGRTVKMKPGEHGWQTLKASMEIPAGTRSLVIHLGAGIADDAGPKTPHYIDEVRVRIITRETPLP